MKQLMTLVAVGAAVLATAGAQAADFPVKDKPITIVVPFSAGGTTDDPHAALGDTFWALLNSSEFLMNH